TKGSGDCVVETLKETIPETNAVQSVGTSVAPATATNIAKSGNNLVDYPESNESSKSLAGSKEVSDPEVVIMGNSVADDKHTTKMSDTGIARRTRSRAGKGVTTVSTHVHKSTPDKSARVTGKKVMTGPPRTKSKVTPTSE
ncbi:hypothetical protein A2U01_0048476, partial [Trifolium medium]|nr:hypothetical protein [Trifolium medium]